MKPKWRLTREWVSQFLAERGFKLLDDHYKNNSTKMNVQCKKGHSFLRSFSKFQRNHIKCPVCYLDRPMKKKGDILPPQKKKKRYKTLLEHILKHCNKKGYKYISHTEEAVEVECNSGHQITKTLNSILQKKHQCQKCAEIQTALRCRKPEEEVKLLAESRGETLLDRIFSGNKKNTVKILCKNNHEYSSLFQNYRKGSGCPKCKFKNETITRDIIEKLTSKKFPKARPDFLKYKNKKNLELDGYCKELKLAFEYDGEQHYMRVFTYDNDDTLKSIQERDKIKDQKCLENGIKLLRVPYFIKDKEEFIKSWLIDNKIIT